jgi:hypothetical protein
MEFQVLPSAFQDIIYVSSLAKRKKEKEKKINRGNK